MSTRNLNVPMLWQTVKSKDRSTVDSVYPIDLVHCINIFIILCIRILKHSLVYDIDFSLLVLREDSRWSIACNLYHK